MCRAGPRLAQACHSDRALMSHGHSLCTASRHGNRSCTYPLTASSVRYSDIQHTKCTRDVCPFIETRRVYPVLLELSLSCTCIAAPTQSIRAQRTRKADTSALLSVLRYDMLDDEKPDEPPQPIDQTSACGCAHWCGLIKLLPPALWARKCARSSCPGAAKTDKLQRSVASIPGRRPLLTRRRNGELSSGAPPVMSRVVLAGSFHRRACVSCRHFPRSVRSGEPTRLGRCSLFRRPPSLL